MDSGEGGGRSYHGRSYAVPLRLDLRAFLVAAVDDSADAIAFVVLEMSLAAVRYGEVGYARRVESRDLNSISTLPL